VGSPRTTALVVGAHGVIGSTLLQHLAGLPDWDVVGVSRRGGVDGPGIRHVAVDLLDAEATARALGAFPEVTHVFYAAFQDRPTWAELVEPNLAMLVNTVAAVTPAGRLQHVSLMQGYKVYGAHLGPFATPAREDDPGHLPPEFNVSQQQHLEQASAGASWSWSALRPSVVCGTALGNPMNLVSVLAVYASMCKELGLPLRFPGKPGAYDTLLEMTDAGLLARATVWAATTPEVMADKQPLWEQMVETHQLQPTPWSDLSSWPFGDGVFSWDHDFLADGSKARRFGFHEHVDTRQMFTDLIGDLRDRRIVP
jgi:nucleoside-diphosphate-sugar epimerase